MRPATLVAKIAGGTAEARQRLHVGFEKEVGFYSTLAATLDVRTPHCWYAALADDHLGFTLLLDDLAPARPGVQADGCSAAQAADAVRNLAGLHAPRWNDASLRDLSFLTPTDAAGAAFLGEILAQATDEFVGRYTDRLDPADVVTLRDAAGAIAAWALARPRPFAVVHGDYRLDNLMFPPSGEGVAVLDWQTVTVGPPLRDVA
jgi:aminoglycoside/choline kinase family phosphotransferase